MGFLYFFFFFFFFQAEDGIRDLYVTGVQTCALPISAGPAAAGRSASGRLAADPRLVDLVVGAVPPDAGEGGVDLGRQRGVALAQTEAVVLAGVEQIGRASCRERVEGSAVGGTIEGER